MFSEKRKFGNIGEEIIAKFLANSGFEIIERNYLKRFGEIDIVAKKDGAVHFIEVKSAWSGVSRETININFENFTISLENDPCLFYGYLLEENISANKKARLARTIDLYLSEHKLHNSPFQVDVAAVLIDFKSKCARVRYTDDVTLL